MSLRAGSNTNGPTVVSSTILRAVAACTLLAGFAGGATDQLAANGVAKAPYPPSPVIRQLRWAPPETIVRKANGSDNWPLTWGNDDWLYTALVFSGDD